MLVAQHAPARLRHRLCAHVCPRVPVAFQDLHLRTPSDIVRATRAWRAWRAFRRPPPRRHVHSWMRRRRRTDETPVMGFA